MPAVGTAFIDRRYTAVFNLVAVRLKLRISFWHSAAGFAENLLVIHNGVKRSRIPNHKPIAFSVDAELIFGGGIKRGNPFFIGKIDCVLFDVILRGDIKFPALAAKDIGAGTGIQFSKQHLAVLICRNDLIVDLNSGFFFEFLPKFFFRIHDPPLAGKIGDRSVFLCGTAFFRSRRCGRPARRSGRCAGRSAARAAGKCNCHSHRKGKDSVAV